MSTQSNIVDQQRAIFHSAGDNSADVESHVNGFVDLVEYVRVGGPGTAVNDYAIICPTVNCKLKAATYIGEALANTAGDDIVLTITTNGVSCVSWNTNTGAQDAIAANTLTDLSPTVTNSFVDTDEQVVLNWTMADAANNNLNGVVRLVFERV